MSLDPAIFRALVEQGASPEMLLAVVEAAAKLDEERRARQIPWPQLRAMAFARDGDLCGYCGSTDGPFEVDHIVPRADGGENVLSNVIIACRNCNRSKKDRDAETWLEERRAKDRERKRLVRGSLRTEGGKSADAADNPPSLDKETSPRPPKEINLSTPEGGNALPRKAGGFRAPDGVAPETWVAFCSQRKKAVTRIAYDRMLKTIGEAAEVGWPPGELFERAVERGYETIFTPSEKKNGQHRPANDRPDEIQNVRLRAAVKLDADRASGQRHAGF